MESTTERRALGQVIKALREMNGMSRDELAEQAGLGIDMIAKVEQGAKSPSARSLKGIAQALGIDSFALSQRGTEWANFLGTPGETATALKKVASGSVAAGVAVGLGLPVVGSAIGASLLTARALANGHDRRQAEMALRMMLEQRLATASEEELDAIAAALSGQPEGLPPSE